MTTRIRSVAVWTWTRLSIACFSGAMLLTLGSFFWAGYALDSPDAQYIGLAIRATVGAALAALALAGAVTAVLAVVAAVGRGTVPVPEPQGIVAAGTLGTRRRIRIAGVFAAVNLVVIAAGALHILVWNPLARVPGLELGELYTQMYALGEGAGAVAFVAVWAVFWAIATIAYVVGSALPAYRPFFTGRRIAAFGLVLISATCLFSWFAGFNMSMSLADAFATSGGDAAWSGPLIALTGQAAMIAALFVVLAPRRGTMVPAEASPAPA
jgi:hypothetical protein